MARRTGLILMGGMLAAVQFGCAHNAITGESSRHEQVYHGTVGITGEDHVVTILPGSQVTKLSIMGGDNRVYVAEGATVAKVEIVGEDNEVTLPTGMDVEYSEIGGDNRLKYRGER